MANHADRWQLLDRLLASADKREAELAPARMLRLIQLDAELFTMARRAEAHGLGIGAYSYYRRVVERQKNRLLDKIIEVGKLYNDLIAKLEAAKGQHQFKQAMDDVKDAIPDVLKIDGHNPLMLLHRATSKGIHDMDDDECLAPGA